jgi:CDP-diacylglycerol---serine O-phosphatidyltransferase
MTPMRRGIYLFPSLLTLANLASGIMSILFSANYHFTSAAWAIIAGIILDMLDGRVARWANATSQFGLELDSLCDAVTFGIAPAVMMYQVALSPLGRPGYAPAIFFGMAAVLRLARFNLRAQTGEASTHFVGLPVPAAAGILASFVLSYELFGDDRVTVKTIPALMEHMPIFYRSVPFIMLLLAFLMVSSVPYGNFKRLKLGRPKSIQTLVLAAVGLLAVFAYPQNMIFILFMLYITMGLLAFAWRYYRAQRAKAMARRFGRRSTDLPDQEEKTPEKIEWTPKR